MPGHQIQEFQFEGGSVGPGPDICQLQFERRVLDSLATLDSNVTSLHARVSRLEGKPVLPLPGERPKEGPQERRPEEDPPGGQPKTLPEKSSAPFEPTPGKRVWKAGGPRKGAYTLIQPYDGPPPAEARMSMPGYERNEYRVGQLRDAWLMAEPKTGNLVVQPIALFADVEPTGRAGALFTMLVAVLTSKAFVASTAFTALILSVVMAMLLVIERAR